MKKRFVMMTAAAVTAALCCPNLSAYAEEAPYADAAALCESWGDDSQPDYVTGVWTESGETDHLVIGLVPGEQGKNGMDEILLQIEDDESASFVWQRYSMRELKEIMDEVTNQMPHVPGLYACAIHESENCVVISAELASPSPELEKMMSCWEMAYGSAVRFEQGSPATPMSDEPFVPDYDPNEYDGLTGEYWEIGAEDVPAAEGTAPEGEIIYDGATAGTDDRIIGAESRRVPGQNRREQPVTVKPVLQETAQSDSANRMLWIACGAVLLAGAGVLVFGILRRRSAARQTSAGTVQTGSASSRRQTEQLIREQEPDLPGDLKSRIMERVHSEHDA